MNAIRLERKEKYMQVYSYPECISLAEIRDASSMQEGEGIEATVAEIVASVRERGDEALRDFTRKFDQQEIGGIAVTQEEIEIEAVKINADLKEAIDLAIENIFLFHSAQRPKEVNLFTRPGLECGQFFRPMEKVGLYVPGGSAPLFSTLLMLAVPALVAGCPEVSVCTPPREDGKVDPTLCYCIAKLGIKSVYRVGGAQAIAAFAYGTQTISKVDKIFGPGNSYVNRAKLLVSRDGIGIDLPAGPSELLIVADGSAEPAYVAADLLSQAEHGPDSIVVLVTTSQTLVDRVEDFLSEQLEELPRKDIARRALRHSLIILVQNIEAAIEVSNSFAPEHLSLQCRNPRELIPGIQNAGSIFLGSLTPEALGDYFSGPNHTLPTAGAARAFGGVSLLSFMKATTWQEISKEAMHSVGMHVATLARAESLEAHARSILIRLEK